MSSKLRILCCLKERINNLAEAEVRDDWTCREYRYLIMGACSFTPQSRVLQWIIKAGILVRSRLPHLIHSAI